MNEVIKVKNLTFSYGKTPVLEGADFSIQEREFACLVGPNGGGKTTLLRLLLGLLSPQTGEISLFGTSPKEGRKYVGYLPQHAQLDPRFPATVLDVAMMGRLGETRTLGGYTAKDREIAREMLDRVGLSGFAHRPLSALSGGQRQRVLIARALVGSPRLLLLDEPTSSLDGYVERELYELLEQLNKELTILVVSHDIGFVSRYVQKVVCVNRHVYIHPTGEIDENTIRSMYGEHMYMVRHDKVHAHD